MSKNINKNSERFLPNEDFDIDSSFCIEKEILDLPQGNTFTDREIKNLEITLTNRTYNNSRLINRMQPIGNMSISVIKNYNPNDAMNFLNDSNFHNNSINKLNAMISLGKVLQDDKFSQQNKKELVIQRITYKRKTPYEYYLSKESNYCVIKCENITTYLVDNFIFSMFTNPITRENDPNINCKYLTNLNNQFEFSNEFLNKLNQNLIVKDCQIDRNQFVKFINGVNEILSNEELLSINEKFKKKKMASLIVTFILFILIIAMIIIGIISNLFYNSSDEEDNNLTILIGFFFVIIILIFLFVKFLFDVIFKFERIKQYEILRFQVKIYENVEFYFEGWNVNLFIPNSVYVSCPVTFNYIQFNLDPFKEIVLENHEIG